MWVCVGGPERVYTTNEWLWKNGAVLPVQTDVNFVADSQSKILFFLYQHLQENNWAFLTPSGGYFLERDIEYTIIYYNNLYLVVV